MITTDIAQWIVIGVLAFMLVVVIVGIGLDEDAHSRKHKRLDGGGWKDDGRSLATPRLRRED